MRYQDIVIRGEIGVGSLDGVLREMGEENYMPRDMPSNNREV